MAIKHIIIFALSFVLFGSVSAQQVKLSRLSRALGQDSIIISNASGVAGWYPKSSLGFLSGSGTDDYYPIWSGGALVDGKIRNVSTTAIYFRCNGTTDSWYMTPIQITSTVVGGPLMNTSSGYTFNSDTDTGVKRQAADIITISAGDATNPTIKVDGVSNFVYFDPDDDGTNDVTISATKTSVELLNIGGFDTDNTTHLEGVDASGDVTKLALSPNNLKFTAGASVDTVEFFNSYGQLYYNGQFDITNTTSDTLLPDFGWEELDAGDIFTTAQYGEITTEYTGFARFFFSAFLENNTGSNYSGYVSFDLYKNNTSMSYPVNQAVGVIANGERKVVSMQMIIPVTTNDDYHIRAYLSSAGTITVVNPVFNLQRI